MTAPITRAWRRTGKLGRTLLAGVCAFACAAPAGGQPVAGKDGGTAGLKVEEAPPPGFESLTEPQFALVDLYFGGEPLARVEVEYTPETIRILDPGLVAGLIPSLLDPEDARRRLAGPMPTNSALVCRDWRPDPDCGWLVPQEGVGAIFDETRLRLELFTAPSMMALAGAGRTSWLPEPDGGPSLLMTLGGAASIRHDGDTAQDHSLFLQATGAVGRTHLMMRGLAAHGERPDLDQAWVGHEWGDWTAMGGLFDEQATTTLRSGRLVGIGIGTSFNLRANRDQAFGSPLQLYLPRRAQVDILRDGRLLLSRQVEAGNQLLDTAGLPEGAYEVTLRINDGSGVREETRFFAKTRDLAPRDAPLFRVEAGIRQPLPGAEPGLSLDGPKVARAEIGFRLGESVGISGSLSHEPDGDFAGIGAVWMSEGLRVGSRAFLSSRADWGGSVYAGGSTGHWRWSLGAYGVKAAEEREDARSAITDSFFQGSADVQYVGRSFSLGVRGTYRGIDGRRDWAVGPYARVPLGRIGDTRIDLNVEGARTADDTRLIVRLGLWRFGLERSLSQTGELAYGWSARGRSSPSAQAAVSWTGGAAEGTAMRATGRALARRGEAGLAGEGEYQGRLGMLRGYGEMLWADGGHGAAAGGEFTTSVSLDGDGFGLGGGGLQASAVVIDLAGSPSDDRFTILVDGNPAGVAQAGSVSTLPLAPYRTYAVSLLPEAGSLVDLATEPRKVTLYPGSVVRLSWEASRVHVVVARIVDPAGAPLEALRIDNAVNPAVTGPDGWVQVEVRGGGVLYGASPGRDCAVEIPSLAAGRQVTVLGDLVCLPTDPNQPQR